MPVIVGVITGVSTPVLSGYFRESELSVRIFTAIGLLAPLGVALGLGFPLGMRIVHRLHGKSAPLHWGINGAASVCASGLAVLISITASIPATFWTGVACYLIALICFLRFWCDEDTAVEPF